MAEDAQITAVFQLIEEVLSALKDIAPEVVEDMAMRAKSDVETLRGKVVLGHPNVKFNAARSRLEVLERVLLEG